MFHGGHGDYHASRDKHVQAQAHVGDVSAQHGDGHDDDHHGDHHGDRHDDRHDAHRDDRHDDCRGVLRDKHDGSHELAHNGELVLSQDCMEQVDGVCYRGVHQNGVRFHIRNYACNHVRRHVQGLHGQVRDVDC